MLVVWLVNHHILKEKLRSLLKYMMKLLKNSTDAVVQYLKELKERQYWISGADLAEIAILLLL